jgi:hypothetical protein
MKINLKIPSNYQAMALPCTQLAMCLEENL